MDPIPETAAENLALWDAGEIVWSVEMGGLGPGYEQCIQIIAFEFIREFLSFDWPELDKLDEEGSRAVMDPIDARVMERTNPITGGPSGAQVGAARNLAANVCRKGYRASLREEAVKDRLIQVSKHFPSIK